MSELIKALTNLRSLRVVVRELSLEQAELTLEKLQLVVNEKREEIAAAKRQEEERLARLDKYRELLAQDGITAEDLANILGSESKKERKKREPLAPKYKYIDENGETKTWTGQGRTPKAIQKQLDAGKKLEDFEI